MQRRELVALSATSLAAVVAGCSGSDSPDDGDDADDSDDSAGNGDDTGNGDAPPLTTLESIRAVDDRYDADAKTFSGSGPATTDEFELDGRLAVSIFEHDGESDFRPALLDEAGERVELLADDSGPVEGAFAFPIESGTYRAEIATDGDWSLEIVQPDPPEEAVHQLPVEASGAGKDVVGPVMIDGRGLFSGTYAGESDFKVTVHDEAAADETGIRVAFSTSDTTGEYEGTASISMDARAWINVRTDGEWTLGVE